MNRFKKILTLILVAAMALSMCATLAGCRENGNTEVAGSGEKGTYTVSVKSAGGLALEGVAVSVYADDTLADMQAYGETNEEGIAKIELETGKTYAATLSGVPAGYEADAELFYFEDGATEMTIVLKVIAG